MHIYIIVYIASDFILQYYVNNHILNSVFPGGEFISVLRKDSLNFKSPFM